MEDTKSEADEDEDFSNASRVGGEMGMEFVSEEVDGEEHTIHGQNARGSEKAEKIIEGCEETNGCLAHQIQ